MKRVIVICILAALLSGCGNTIAAGDGTLPASESGEVIAATVPAVEDAANEDSNEGLSITEELVEIPKEYFAEAQKQGSLVELYYDTYESTTTSKPRPMKNCASFANLASTN